MWTEKQLTFDAKNHDLDDNYNFSPDGQWLVYDIRDEGGIGDNPAIEKVNVKTGEMVTVYEVPNQAPYGPGCGAMNYHPTENKLVFIHGLFNCTPENPYQQWHRFGMIIDESNPDVPIIMDARDIVKPTTPGALSGGTHSHRWSADGQWIGFTYNDAHLATVEQKTGKKVNLRTVGVSHNTGPVSVEKLPSGENFDGAWFSALIVKVVPDPKPGSDQIIRADGDRWLGTYGYKITDGRMQQARTFLGHVKEKNGNTVKEVFVVDVPKRIDEPSEILALQGTDLYIPRGATQRRLTYTTEWKHAGVARVTSSENGSIISFLAKDAAGRYQIYFIPPTGGELAQVTHHQTTIQLEGGLRWQPGKNAISYLLDNTLMLYSVSEKKSYAISKQHKMTPFNLAWSHDGRVLAYNKILPTGGQNYKQVFVLRKSN
ncbi:MAG: DUF3748 domain-containing protein [Calditrichaeota bacterium]|nr:MAG: DUF3748 domain-containing protein [Calditrichota bacterium]